MKKHLLGNLKTILSISFVLLLFSCEKSDDLNLDEITGTYIGTITTDISSKSSGTQKTVQTAIAVVSDVGGQIEVHCYDEDFDITIMLDFYHHNDSINVCLTGNDFENMYGHKSGHGDMNGNMQSNGTEWMQHLNNEHQNGDEHFGGFDMQDHSFNYTFKMDNGDFHFQGIKN